MRYGISTWKAERWVAAAEALESLPSVVRAFCTGHLGIDKVVELTRFATPETERGLISWAADRPSGAIRRRGDLERRLRAEQTLCAERERSVRWCYSPDGTRFELEAELPADQGAVVASALSRLAETIPASPEDRNHPYPAEARRADALVMVCSGRIASDPDPDRATLVVHARAETLGGVPDAPNAEIEGGPVIGPQAAQRLACDARLQVVAEDAHANPLRLGRLTRTPSAQMLRSLRYRS
ncbi:MAG: DUF222 domain-containing protein, partial [Actinobacteria bacterium]|nr:DUF222 domain-containing protein [Actinomycetota bacterium]